MTRTREGYIWTEHGQREGLETDAVVNSTPSIQPGYDVIVIGAGWAGLVAARDISERTSLRVLLVEARDRIGGRTWTAKERGQTFEMGGGWITWTQPHLWTELQRYGMDKHITASDGTSMPGAMYFRSTDNTTTELDDSHDRYSTFDSIFDRFFALDGHTSRSLMPFPHDPFREPAPWKQYDHFSVKDRIEQLRSNGKFSDSDLDMFESLTNGSGLTQAGRRGFSEFLFWWALGGHSMAGITEANGVWKIGSGGMTEFARRVLADYDGDVLIDGQVVGIKQAKEDEWVQLHLWDGRRVCAKHVISTIPLNCLSTIEFDPPLSPLRQEAIRQGHVNLGSKIHFETTRTTVPWVSLASPNSDATMPSAFADHSTDNHTYSVAFGYAEAEVDLKDASVVRSEFGKLFSLDHQPKISAYVTHDWKNDPYAKGAWVAYAPGYMLKYQQELQNDHGKVLFASADWVDGWRGFVDGAIAAGKLAAGKVIQMYRRKSGV